MTRRARSAKEAGIRGALKRRAGSLAAAVAAVIGLVAGMGGALLSGAGATPSARIEAGAERASRPALREEARLDERAALVDRILSAGAPERLSPGAEAAFAAGGARPKVVLIIDDMGIDPALSEAAIALPGPLTFSFLPYAPKVQAQADAARARGGEIMLHLPMAPSIDADPGPNSLWPGMDAIEIIAALQQNLSQLDGFVGVNNHMGSAFTEDEKAMRIVLQALSQEGVYFLDSLTTPRSAAKKASRNSGLRIASRDIFLDPAPGPAVVREQLQRMEMIARATGYVVAIAHPRQDTLDVLGPWMTTAPERGFDLVHASSLFDGHATKVAGGAQSLAP